MKRVFRFVRSKVPYFCSVALILAGVTSARTSPSEFRISGQPQDLASVRIEFEHLESSEQKIIRLYRSTHSISPDKLDPVRYPIMTMELTTQDVNAGFLDRSTAQNVTYYYMAAVDSLNTAAIYSNIIAVATDKVELPQLTQPEVWIDKVHYYLEIWDQGKLAKRYPIILGRDPLKRKLHQDFATTPEGVYKVTNRKLRSTFRHAFDIDYPNSTDRIRYDLLKSAGKVPAGKNIGGEIQIHGQLRNWRLERNWTWGCIALRNEDIDELFDHKEIKVGTPVYILGEQLTREDLSLISRIWEPEKIQEIQRRLREMDYYQGLSDGILGRQTRLALGKYQLAKGYPVTCELDSRTLTDLLPSHQ